MRIATGSFIHESSTFTTVETTRDSFRTQRFGYLRGAEVLEHFDGTNSAVGGFLAGCREHGYELIPTIYAGATPSAPIPRAVFDEILGDMLGRLEAAGPVDGVLLDLHGAMVAEGIDDGEGHILAAVRQVVGGAPVVAQEERGRECAQVMHRILEHGLRPVMALSPIPLMWGMNQVTAHPPMRQAIEYLHRIEARPGVICGSIATCFPLADIPHMGASVYVAAADGDAALAQGCADELAAWIWERRADWQTPMPSSAEALKEARRAGAGARLRLEVGARSTPLQGRPVTMDAEVVLLGDGGFRYEGPRNRGLAGTMGPSAHIRQEGVHVLLVTRREQPYGLAFSLTMGLDPRRMRYVGVKSAAHFRAGFEPWAGRIHVVSEPWVHSPEGLTYRNLGRKVYPLDDI